MRYTVIAGGRRYAAIRSLVADPALDDAERDGLRRVAVVLHRGAAAERRVLQLVENIQREALTPVEEARALREIARVEGLSTAAVAGRIHRSQGYVDERLRLLRHEAVEAAVEAGVLTASAGAAVASLPDAAARAAWLARAGGGERVAAAAVYASKAPARSRRAPAPPPVAVTPPSAVAPVALPTFPALPALPATTESDDTTLDTLRTMRAALSRLAPPADAGRRREYATALASLLDAVGDALSRLYP
jgi:ParB family chromosome partitioning protein